MTRRIREQRRFLTGTLQQPGGKPQIVRLNMDDIREQDELVTVTDDYTIEGKKYVLADASGTALTVTLPPAIDSTDRYIFVKKIDASANTVIIDGNASEQIDGASSITLTAQYSGRSLVCDGANWFLI